MRFFIDQHGCAKNQVDGEEIVARLEAEGHTECLSPEEADLFLVNSCGFIEGAKKESIDAVLELRERFPGKKILLAGCLAQRYALALADELPEADGIVGNADLAAVAVAAAGIAAGERPVLVPKAAPRIGDFPRKRLFDYPGLAHVKITEGCSNKCAYCAIPLIRGELRSRLPTEVVEECRVLLARGIKEIVLVGQDLGSYGKDREARGLLPELLAALSKLPGDFRVRVLYIHPDNFPRGILPIMKVDPRILPYFDLPFQHASSRILKSMNRRGDAATYLELVAHIRETLPDAMIRSTFLVGFPGETEADFDALTAFQEAARLDWLGSFAYSREEDTPAFAFKGKVPKKTAAARKKAVEEIQERITRERLERFVGRELEVLVEERVRKSGEADDEELAIGRAYCQAPDVDGLTVLRGDAEPGTMVRARILAVTGVDLDALILDVAPGTSASARPESSVGGMGEIDGGRGR